MRLYFSNLRTDVLRRARSIPGLAYALVLAILAGAVLLLLMGNNASDRRRNVVLCLVLAEALAVALMYYWSRRAHRFQ